MQKNGNSWIYTVVAAACLSMGNACFIATANAADEAQKMVVEQSSKLIPMPPWPKGDQRGMANTIGAGTWARCGYHLSRPDAKVYEISHVRSNTMPLSPFGAPLQYKFNPSTVLPGTRHAFNGEVVTGGEPGAQGTQFDALGHFAYLDEAWDGKSEAPAAGSKYYGGYGQKDVKPSADSPLQKLGVEQVPPIITTAVLLDAKTYVGKGKALQPGTLVTRKDIDGMIESQGLGWRGLLAGDVVYVHTGWGENWKDPDADKTYYMQGPGLAVDAAEYLAEKAVVLVALDNPFTDAVAAGQLQGKAMPPQGMDKGLPFIIHHQNLTQSGIHNIQNANLGALARDKVWTSCTIILPLRSKGHSGSPVRPVAIGVPGN